MELVTAISMLSAALLAQPQSGPATATPFQAQPVAPGPGVEWYTADMHTHAHGCQLSETAGALLKRMKDTQTNVASTLVWGNLLGWQNFLGQEDDPVSEPDHIVHWDVEVSGMPSHWHGHQMMLNIAQVGAVQGGIPRWPGRRYNLPNYDWAQSGGGIVGYAHGQRWITGSYTAFWQEGLAPRELPLDVTLKKVDFLLTEKIEDRDYYWLWYQMLDAGFHIAPAAGSDFPCLATKLAVNHTVFSLPMETKLSFDRYIAAVRNGATVIRKNKPMPDYLDLRVDGQGLGSELDLPSGPAQVVVEIDARGSEAGTRLELVVNSKLVQFVPIDSNLQTYKTTVGLNQSSWLAARLVVDGPQAEIQAHSAATFVRLGGCPIRVDPAAALAWANYLSTYYLAALANAPVGVTFHQDVTAAAHAWLKIAAEGIQGCP